MVNVGGAVRAVVAVDGVAFSRGLCVSIKGRRGAGGKGGGLVYYA